MEKKRKWGNPQALIIIAIIIVLFLYIGVDSFKTTPVIRAQVDSVKVEYKNLSKFLDKKMPEIDSTLILQASQIKKQTTEIEGLRSSINKIGNEK